MDADALAQVLAILSKRIEALANEIHALNETLTDREGDADD